MSENRANSPRYAAQDGLNRPPATPRPPEPFREPQRPRNRHDSTCPTWCAYCDHLIDLAEQARDEAPLASEDWK